MQLMTVLYDSIRGKIEIEGMFGMCYGDRINLYNKILSQQSKELKEINMTNNELLEEIYDHIHENKSRSIEMFIDSLEESTEFSRGAAQGLMRGLDYMLEYLREKMK